MGIWWTLKRYIPLVLIWSTQSFGGLPSGNSEIFLSVSSYQQLSSQNRINYIREVRSAFFNYEMVTNVNQLVEISLPPGLSRRATFALALKINSVWAEEGKRCLVGGVSVPRISGLCSTRNNTCVLENSDPASASDSSPSEDSFKCGPIFGSACVRRTPISSLSQRCHAASPSAENGIVDYDTFKKTGEELHASYCQNDRSDGCKVLNESLAKAKQTANGGVDIASDSKATAATSATQTSPSTSTPTSRNRNSNCTKIMNLVIEGTSIQESPTKLIREKRIHQEAKDNISTTAARFNSSNYWLEPTLQPITPGCSESSGDPEVAVPQSKMLTKVRDAVKATQSQTGTQNKTCDSGVAAALNSLKSSKPVILKDTAEEQARKPPKGSYNLLPQAAGENCSESDKQSRFTSFRMNTGANAFESATSNYLKDIQSLRKTCGANLRITATISVYARDSLATNSKGTPFCGFSLTPSLNVSAQQFSTLLLKPLKSLGVNSIVNIEPGPNGCMHEALQAEVSKGSRGKSKTCLLKTTSYRRQPFALEPLFESEKASLYTHFLGEREHPLESEICALGLDGDNMNSLTPQGIENLVKFFQEKTQPRFSDSTLKTRFVACHQSKMRLKQRRFEGNPKSSNSTPLSASEYQKILNCLPSTETLKPTGKNSSTSQIPASVQGLFDLSNTAPEILSGCDQDLRPFKKPARGAALSVPKRDPAPATAEP